MRAQQRVWLRVADKTLLTAGLERGFGTFVADADRADALRGLGKCRLLALRGAAIEEGGKVVGARVEIASVEDQRRALALAGRHEVVLAAAKDWKIIPYENMIAAYQNRGTTLAVESSTVADVLLFLETLEIGVDAVVYAPGTVADVVALAEALARKDAADVPLARAVVTGVRLVGSGDRVCVDTASLLRTGEGILVGNSAGAMALVHAETFESGYVASRPFRVNAGPVHAYVLLPSGKTKYLSELAAGDEVVAVDAKGRARNVLVGRVKIETRPLLLVEAESEGRRFSLLLQNAETIRLVTPDGGAISVVDLKEGDAVLARFETGGRHFGMAVRETITER